MQYRLASVTEMSSQKVAVILHWEILSSLDGEELEYFPSRNHKVQAKN